MGKPKAPKSTHSGTTTVNPYTPAEPMIKDMLTQAQIAMGSTPKTPVFTGPNADQLKSIEMLKAFASGQAGAGYNAVLDNANKTASGFYLDPKNNPTVQGAIQAAINPLRDQLDENILSIGDAAKMAGAYGGDRQDLLKATSLSRFNRDSMDIGSQIAFQAFEAERNRMMGAAKLFQDANALGMEPARIMSALGDQQSQWDVARRQSELDAPWAGLDRYAQLLQSVQGYGTTKEDSVTKGTPGGSRAGGALSGALGGASAGAAFGPWGAGIGAVVGGLGGLFG